VKVSDFLRQLFSSPCLVSNSLRSCSRVVTCARVPELTPKLPRSCCEANETLRTPFRFSSSNSRNEEENWNIHSRRSWPSAAQQSSPLPNTAARAAGPTSPRPTRFGFILRDTAATGRRKRMSSETCSLYSRSPVRYQQAAARAALRWRHGSSMVGDMRLVVSFGRVTFTRWNHHHQPHTVEPRICQLPSTPHTLAAVSASLHDRLKSGLSLT
jgi:hypothetical protein